MSASNLGNDYINEENSPIPIPPAKDGWADMERRLNATPPSVRLTFLQKAAMIAGIVVVSGIAFAITYHAIYHSPASPSPAHSPLSDTSSAGALAGANILLADSIQAGYFSLDKYLPTPAGITGADKLHRDTPLVITTGHVRDEAGVNTTNNGHAGTETNGNNEIGGNDPETAAPEVSVPATSSTHREGTNARANPVKGTNVTPNTARANANPAGHNVGARTNTKGKALPVAHSTGTGMNIKANTPPAKINAAAHHTANPTAPDTATVANVKAASKKTNNGAITKGRPGNASSAITTPATSPEKNMTATPATGPVKRDIGSSFPPLQSLPLTRINHSVLAQRPPQSITSRINKIRQRDLPEWQLLLQWQLPVPLSGSAYYLSGPNGNNQLYRLLIPGIRVVRKWNAHSISLDLMPFTAQTYNDPLIRESSIRNADSTTNKLKLMLHKEFGASGTILYHHRILKQWQVAAGGQLNYWLTQSGGLQTLRYPPWAGNAIDSSNTGVKESIQRPQLKIPLEIYYSAPRWQAGLRVDVPVHINRSDSIKTPVQLQLMLRYKLLPRRK